MPKHKKKNAFYFFMEDWKIKKEKEGQRFPGGMSDVQKSPEIHKAWKDLTKEQKKFYQEKEKNQKEEMDKKNSLGESLILMQQAAKKEEEFQDNMKTFLSTLINKANENNSIKNLKFIVIHVNYYYRRSLQENLFEYCPAEVALAEFSLENGVIRTYHQIINPIIKLGYACEAQIQSSQSHQIPTTDNLNEKSYEDVYEEIIDFLNHSSENGKLPPLYTVEGAKFPVISVLQILSGGEENFLIYSFEELFACLNNLKKQKEPNEFFKILLSKDRYDFKKSTACEFHSELGSINFCSKSIVQRWIFTLIDQIHEVYEIKLVSGLHLPKEYELKQEPLAIVDAAFGNLNITRTNRNNPISGGAIRKEVSREPKNRSFHEEDKLMNDSFTMVDRTKNKRSKNSKPFTYDEVSFTPIANSNNSEKSRNQENCASFTIIDYSEKNEKSENLDVFEKSLRRPSTKPISYEGFGNSPNLHEDNFPALGRGSGKKNRGSSQKPSRGGYSSFF